MSTDRARLRAFIEGFQDHQLVPLRPAELRALLNDLEVAERERDELRTLVQELRRSS